MSYREVQRRKATAMRETLFRDPGAGLFSKKERDFVLQDPTLNLWAGIRNDVIEYFKENSISWWMGDDNTQPTGHLLSSQVACINHSYSVRQRGDVATALLKGICNQILESVSLHTGFVEFEVIGKQNYLKERSHTRGANATSVDAAMVGRKNSGSNILFFIEWKYTEHYREVSKYIPDRYKIYNPLLEEEQCPINVEDVSSLYYEPFYQLMRQTLLAWKMVQNGEYQCDEWVHLHVIPEDNTELRERITSPAMRSRGDSMSGAWKSVLREPLRYILITPQEFLRPAFSCLDTYSIKAYLEKRYWS